MTFGSILDLLEVKEEMWWRRFESEAGKLEASAVLGRESNGVAVPCRIVVRRLDRCGCG
jgi:hypothetical protein